MKLSDTIRRATASAIPNLLASLANATVTTTRYTKTRDAAKRPINSACGARQPTSPQRQPCR
jgi:hypothetical protein